MRHHLAQINAAKFRLPMADPVNADFVASLDKVNAIAEAQPGFVWRLTGDGNDATDIQAFADPNVIVNMSIRTDLEALVAFVYRESAHRDIMRRRREWFERLDFFMALWWVPAGHRPSLDEGLARLDLLTRLGPTPNAFLFTRPFGPPGVEAPEPIRDQWA
jgi:hypothetical protein